MLITDSKFYKLNFTDNTNVAGAKDVEIAVPLRDLLNFLERFKYH